MSESLNGMDGMFRAGLLDKEWNWSRHVFESVANGITVSDATAPDLPLIYVNPAFTQLTGYAREEILGQNCRFLQGSDTQQAGLTVLRQALRANTDVRTVLKNYRKDGSGFWNELYMSPIRDSEGRLTHYLGIQNDVSSRVELETRLGHMAHHDMLTGLVNRTLLLDRIEQALLRVRRTGSPVAILFFDLDNFKLVNDVFGHDAGDSLLKLVAARLLQGVRQEDTVARLGGDEFIVLLAEPTDGPEAQDVMQRMIDNIRQPMSVSGQEFCPSVSAGMALFPRDGKTVEELLRFADLAMYAAKHLRKSAEAQAVDADPVEESLKPC